MDGLVRRGLKEGEAETDPVAANPTVTLEDPDGAAGRAIVKVAGIFQCSRGAGVQNTRGQVVEGGIEVSAKYARTVYRPGNVGTTSEY